MADHLGYLDVQVRVRSVSHLGKSEMCDVARVLEECMDTSK